jgi:hypothetical protein
VRIDGRLTDRLNIFARYSIADFSRNGPQAFGDGGGDELVSLGGLSEVTNHSLALGADYALSNNTILDVRFGYFKYKVDVLPNGFGTTPATDAGIPGLNFDDFSSGLPAFFIGGDSDNYNMAFGSGLGDRVGRCNCPLAQDEEQFQVVTNLTKQVGNHTFKFGIDVRRALNLRVPSDRHRAGELSFSPNRTSLQGTGGLALATFLLGDVTGFSRYVSPNTDARERQWRHFYYAQDTWRVNDKLTLNYGLRLDVINPQTVNEAGNGGWLDAQTGEIRVGGVGGIDLAGNVQNSMNWAPRLGITYQLNEKTVIRAGYGRSYDIGVFGSTFGHSVTQNLPVLSVQELNAPSNFDRVFTLAEGPPPPQFAEPGADGRFPLPNGVFSRELPEKQRLPALDAYNVTFQRQLTDTMAFELAYVGNKGTHVFAGDGPAVNHNEPIIDGFTEGVPRNDRRPFFAGPIQGFGGAFGWTQGIDFFCNCADNRYDSIQTKLTRRFANGYSFQAHYTWQKVRQDGAEGLFFFPQYREVSRGRPDWDRVHNFVITALVELPFGKGKPILSDASGALNQIVGGWQFNTNVIIQSGLPFSVNYAGAGADRDIGPNRADETGDPGIGSGDGISSPYFNVTPIGESGSPWGRPAAGTYGNSGRNAYTGPGYWRVDGSLFKRFELGGSKMLELRVEAVNLLNHVNLGNPDSEVGSPGNPRTNAGRITNTAYFGADPQRNLQFALRFLF